MKVEDPKQHPNSCLNPERKGGGLRFPSVLSSGGRPTFFLLLGRRAAGGLVAGLLGEGNGGDDAGLPPQPPLLLLLLQVLQDVLRPLVRARHRPRRERLLQGEGGGSRGERGRGRG